MKRNNKKGIVESGILAILAAIVGVVASTGILFSGANPQGSAFFLTASAATAYTQMPHVKRDFREKKAVAEFNITQADAEALSDADLLDLIRDDAPGVPSGRSDAAFAAVGMLPRLGG